MLEVFDNLENKDYKTQIKILKEAFEKQKGFSKLLNDYIVDQNKFFTPQKIFCMMRYLQVERRRDINKIGEIGEYAAYRNELIKMKEFKRKNKGNFAVVNMENISFLFDVQKKLKANVQNKAQYRTLKNAFILMKPLDVKWFTRLLCRKIKITKPMLEVIKNAKIQNNL